MNNDEFLQLSELDVLCFLDARPWSLPKTVRFIEFKEALEERAVSYEKDKHLINGGVECELLQPGSSGWQKGKLKIKIEFIPEKPNHSSELEILRSRVIE